jgi:hypothetical protein
VAEGRPSKTSVQTAIREGRRSTRISRSVPLSVSGQSSVGHLFSELTSTLWVNCHGCSYPSRYEYKTGSWVTLEFPNPQTIGKTQTLRAQVRFTRLPRSPQELYTVGVELESPTNAWGIESPPEDWIRFRVQASAAAGAASAVAPVPECQAPAPSEQETRVPPDSTAVEATESVPSVAAESTLQASTHPHDPPKPVRRVISADQLLRILEAKLKQVAEKAVASALGTAVNQAVTAIDNFSQANIRQIEERCTKYQGNLVTSAHAEFLGRLQVDIARAEEQLRKQLEVSLAEAQEVGQRLEKSAATNIHLVLAEAVDYLKETARELQDQFSTRLSETTDRAAAELASETVRFSDRQLALFAKNAQTATGEAAAGLEARAAEAGSQLETALGTALDEFHRRADIEIEQAASKARLDFESSLTSFAAEIRADWEARQRACQDELARSSEQEGEQFRERLEALLNSSMVAAMSAVNEHSKVMLDSLTKAAGSPLRAVGRGQASR